MLVLESKDIKSYYSCILCLKRSEETWWIKEKKKLLEMKTKLDGINSILVIVEKKISEFEDMAIEPSTIK